MKSASYFEGWRGWESGYKALFVWVCLMGVQCISLSRQLYQEVSELEYRKTKCESSAEERANAKLECSRAIVALRYGWGHYVQHEGIYRLKGCGVHACSDLMAMIRITWWDAVWTIATVAFTSVGFWLFVYNGIWTVKEFTRRRRVEKFMAPRIAQAEKAERAEG